MELFAAGPETEEQVLARGADRLRPPGVRQGDGRGRHTTTRRELIPRQ